MNFISNRKLKIVQSYSNRKLKAFIQFKQKQIKGLGRGLGATAYLYDLMSKYKGKVIRIEDPIEIKIEGFLPSLR